LSDIIIRTTLGLIFDKELMAILRRKILSSLLSGCQDRWGCIFSLFWTSINKKSLSLAEGWAEVLPPA
jgi:hypothetical protein